MTFPIFSDACLRRAARQRHRNARLIHHVRYSSMRRKIRPLPSSSNCRKSHRSPRGLSELQASARCFPTKPPIETMFRVFFASGYLVRSRVGMVKIFLSNLASLIRDTHGNTTRGEVGWGPFCRQPTYIPLFPSNIVNVARYS